VDDQQRDGMSDTPQAWDSVHRVREPIACALLAFTAITVLVSACQLFNLAGAKVPIPIPVAGPGGAMSVSAFALRASAVAPQFVAAIVTAPPVLSVVLVAFSGDLTEHARQVVQTAAVVQAVTFVIALISLAGAAGSHTRPGTWFILVAAELAIAATALFFTGAVIWSRAFPSAAPRFGDAGDDDQGSESDADFRP
jgi:hypothetical protein